MTAITSAATTAASEAATHISDGSWLTTLVDWSVSLMEVIGPIGAGIAIALENLFPPLPSEVILPMAGLTASRGTFTLAEALIWTTLGSVVGAFLLYGIGAVLGLPACAGSPRRCRCCIRKTSTAPSRGSVATSARPFSSDG